MDGLEKEMSGRLDVIRVDIHTRDGRELANQMGFEYTPTFILFSADGAELWRQVGGLDVDRVRQSVGE
ncbi:MAG: thioredoxin [Chloroflexi bacterium]|nr:MAG: thioredoxin [Chloroflexota bacterium]